LSFSAASADTVKFSQAAFADATKAGKSVLVDVAASWCPTCKAQHPIITELTSSDAYKKFVVFEVDFDSQLDALRAFRVQKQSTLI
ncbi:thioredoxin family protein, partial [Acinetobacter baumannii]